MSVALIIIIITVTNRVSLIGFDCLHRKHLLSFGNDLQYKALMSFKILPCCPNYSVCGILPNAVNLRALSSI